MSTTTASLEAPALTRPQLAGVWARHLLSLYIPVNSLIFLVTAPHPW